MAVGTTGPAPGALMIEVAKTGAPAGEPEEQAQKGLDFGREEVLSSGPPWA